MIDPAPLQKHIRSAKRWQKASIFMFGLCIYIVAWVIYDPSPLMIEYPWVQGVAVTINVVAAVLNWNTVFNIQAFVRSARKTLARVEEFNRVIG